MKSLKYYIQKAYKEHWAIGQFNFSDWSQVRGIVAAARATRAPIILGTSEGESKFVGLQEAVAMRNVLRKKIRSAGSGQADFPIFLNLDHGKSFDYLKEAIEAGYDMVHFDGSKLPLDENIRISKEVVKYARWRNVVVEGEVGRFGTDASKMYTEKFEIKETDLTKTEDTVTYLKKTSVDILAVSIGTFHGLDISGVSPNIRLDRLKEIADALKTGAPSKEGARPSTKFLRNFSAPVPLVLHGGSGTPESDIKEAIKLGIAKININTETRLVFTKTLRESLETNKDEITPYKYMQNSIEAVQKVIEEKIKLFGSEGKV